MQIYENKRNCLHKKKNSTPTGLAWKTNMAAVSLFWNISMAAVTSCENALWSALTNVAKSCANFIGTRESFYIRGRF